MGWVLLAVTAVAVAAGVSVLRGGGSARRHPGMTACPRRACAERDERPHRQIAHYRASGALPRWDP